VRISLLHVQFHEGNNIFPPLGILYVGAVLRNAGHEVQILDRDPRRRADTVADMVAFRPDVVGLSFMTMTYDRAVDVARQLRDRLPRAHLIAGGPHPTADPEGTLRAMAIDSVAVGEGEATMLDLVQRLEAGEDLAGTPGLWVDPDTAPPPRAAIEDLDSLPFPARDLLGHGPYLRPPGLIRGYASSRIASMLASRGCPFACSFCASKQQLGKAVRFRSPDDLMAELDHLVAVDGIRGMYFVDDLFTHDREWTLAFCAALRRRPYRLEWACQARVHQVDEALLRAMKAAGCVQIDYGVESGSARVLKAMRKGTKPAQIVAAFALTRKVGLRTGASFVLGSPGETEADLQETAAIARQIDADWTVFFLSTPYPGTHLHKQTEDHHDAYPQYGEHWNNRITARPFEQGSVSPDRLRTVRASLQNRHFRRNYLHRRNVPFILRLAPTLARPHVARTALSVTLGRGRMDDLVEAAFAEWREA
jgi:anaerobic magnesium-protoporphyrin IX monomethyl ester cyclase